MDNKNIIKGLMIYFNSAKISTVWWKKVKKRLGSKDWKKFNEALDDAFNVIKKDTSSEVVKIILKDCVICKEPILPDSCGWDGGHNPWPVRKKGRCCGECNDMIVIPRRLIKAGFEIDGTLIKEIQEHNHESL